MEDSHNEGSEDILRWKYNVTMLVDRDIKLMKGKSIY